MRVLPGLLALLPLLPVVPVLRPSSHVTDNGLRGVRAGR